MKKVKFNFKKVENFKIEMEDGQEIEMKPYISTDDALAITKLCLDYFENTGVDSFPAIHLIYDMAVTELCTSISFDGIKSKNVKGVKTITLDLDADKIVKFENTLMSDFLCEIRGYEEVFDNIIKAIELKNTYMAIKGLAESIPSADSMGKALNQVMREFKKIKEEDPELLEVAIKDKEKKDTSKLIK